MTPQQMTLKGAKVLLGGSGAGSAGAILPIIKQSLPTTPHCTLEQFQVSCTHAGRSIKLDALHGKPSNKQGQYLLQVIASDIKADKIKVELTGNCRQCSIHKSSTPQFLLTGPTGSKTHTGSDIVKVYGRANQQNKHDYLTFFKEILIPNSHPNVYTISPEICDANASAVIVEAYAPVKWDGHIGIEYQHEKKDKLSKESSTVEKLLFRDKWKPLGQIDISRNNEHWTLGNEIDDDDNNDNDKKSKNPKVFGGIQSFFEHIMPLFSSMKDLINIDVKWPKITLGGNVENSEDSNV